MKKGFTYTGALEILKVALSYDYLWINLRVKGGAYGCMSGFKRSGESFFVSYRDPHLRRTLEVYEGVPEYVRTFAADEREMTKIYYRNHQWKGCSKNTTDTGGTWQNGLFPRSHCGNAAEGA